MQEQSSESGLSNSEGTFRDPQGVAKKQINSEFWRRSKLRIKMSRIDTEKFALTVSNDILSRSNQLLSKINLDKQCKNVTEMNAFYQ